MNGITDLLNLSALATITVNNAAQNVPLIGVPADFQNFIGNEYFQDGDNVLLQSVTIKLPYCYGAADSTFAFGLSTMGAGGTLPCNEVGSGGSIYLLIPQWEVQYPVWIPQPAAHAGAKWKFRQVTNGAFGLVSMVNSPAALNGMVLPVSVGLKVVHTLPMIT